MDHVPQRPSRRSLLKGGVVASAALLAAATPAAAAASAKGLDIWAINTRGFAVPSDHWTIIPWQVVLNDSPVHLDTDRATWLFPATPNGIYSILCNVAWDNARSPSGKQISPPTHRKLVRIMQQGTGTPQRNQIAYIGAVSDLTYHGELAQRGDQALLADGSRGYQQQQVAVQAAVPATGRVTRIWIEVYQNSGMTLRCPWDGTSAPKTATRPPVVGLLAPSVMIGKMASL